jgi:hypothetical protein
VGDRTELLVAPVTHSKPERDEGIEIPPPMKRHLGLDKDRSWIINWPGPDVRLVPGGDDPFIGAAGYSGKRHSLRPTKRTE